MGSTDKLLSRQQWKARGRRVRKGEKPQGTTNYRVWKPELERTEDEAGQPKISYTPTEVEQQLNLYSVDQTAPYRMSRRTAAYECYFDIFGRRGHRKRHIKWFGSEMDGEPGWKNQTGAVRLNDVIAHINLTPNARTGTVTKFGVVGGKRTRFKLIDHDLHGGDRDIFLQQAKILIDHLYGRDGWHLSMASQDANGLHLIQALPDPADTLAATTVLRLELMALDAKYPDLAELAKQAGMPTFAGIEIYPRGDRGVRLPLGEGRIALLDRPLPLVQNRHGRQVHDVEGYIAWILNRDRKYMSRDEAYAYLVDRLKPAAPPVKGKQAAAKMKAASQKQPTPVKVPRQGQQAKLIHAFWDLGEAVGVTLNEAINEMARIMAHHPDFMGGAEAAEAILEQMVRGLPNFAISQRLANDNWAAIGRVIEQSTSVAFSGNRSQEDSEASTAKLLAVGKHWSKKGYLPWDRQSRLKFASSVQIDNQPLAFTEYHLDFIDRQIVPVLKCDKATARRFINYFLNFVRQHRGEISTYVLLKQLLNNYGIPAGNDKLAGFMELLRSEGWIYIKAMEQWHHGRNGRARAYGIGENALGLFKDTKPTNSSTTNTPPPCASIIVSAGVGTRLIT